MNSWSSTTTAAQSVKCRNCKTTYIGRWFTVYYVNGVGPICENCWHIMRQLSDGQLTQYAQTIQDRQ